MHDFWACHWGVEVEIFQTEFAVARTFCGDSAVEMDFDRDHVHGGGTAIPRTGDMIATNGNASAIGIGLLKAIVDAHAFVCDVFASFNQDVV